MSDTMNVRYQKEAKPWMMSGQDLISCQPPRLKQLARESAAAHL